MPTLAKRVADLEQRAAPRVIATRWHDDDFISVQGVQMPLDEFRRRYPNATVIHMTWGDDDAPDPIAATLPG